MLEGVTHRVQFGVDTERDQNVDLDPTDNSLSGPFERKRNKSFNTLKTSFDSHYMQEFRRPFTVNTAGLYYKHKPVSNSQGIMPVCCIVRNT